jgi:hypothetical protein
MKRTLSLALLLLLAGTSLGRVPVADTPYAILEIEYDRNLTPAQQIYNISSYHDFAVVASSIIADTLVNYTTGDVYTYGDADWELLWFYPALTDYYWALVGLDRLLNISISEGTPNATLSIMISRVATRMAELFFDPDYGGFYIDLFSNPLAGTTKRAGQQAYAYLGLSLAERVNDTLDFSIEKQSAIICLTDMLYDSVNGGFHFFTLRNGSLDVPEYLYEVYPHDGKRLDHVAMGALALFEEGEITGNMTLTTMANASLTFMVNHMQYTNQSVYHGLRLAVNRTGYDFERPSIQRPARTVVTDINALAISSLLTGYRYTGVDTYFDVAQKVMNALVLQHWDRDHGGWFLETLDGYPYVPPDPELGDETKYYKYSEAQFQMVRALEDFYEVVGELKYVRLIIDTLDIALSKLWDSLSYGFIRNGDREGSSFSDEWKKHFTAIQAQGTLALERVWQYGLPIISYVRVNPSNPRPQDWLDFVVTAQDADGIDTVFVNCTAALGGQTNITLLQLMPNPEFSGIFNTTIDGLPDGTQVNFIVLANDTLGNTFIAGNYYFAVREDVWEPVVIQRAIYPQTDIRVGDEIVIEFGTHEFPLHSRIVACDMYWKVNDGVYEPHNMTLVEVDGEYLVWRILLGQFAEGDLISYYVLAEDEVGNVGTSAFFRLEVLGPITTGPLVTWQVMAGIGLVALPPVGYGVMRLRKTTAMSTQRDLKKEAKRRSRRKRPRSRSRRG